MKKIKKVSYRFAQDVDISLIYNMEKQMFADAWSESQLMGHLQSGGRIVLAEDQEYHMLGYLVMHGVLDEWEIYRIAVAPESRRLGIGGNLIQWFIKTSSFSYSTIRLFLEVRKSNDARLFYERLGFLVVGSRKNYYKDGEDCMLYAAEYDIS